MKTITTIEAYLQITEILENFIKICEDNKDKPVKLYATIENVGFADLISLFYKLKAKSHEKQIYLPGEFDEKLNMYYRPCDGCVIMIESEPAQPLKTKKFNLINLN